MKILMVCLGNICRSPMAEGIMTELVRQNALDWQIDSAGTGSWHIGESPDRRAIATCTRKGIDIAQQRARQVCSADLDAFDLVFAMDRTNYADLRRLARTDAQKRKIHLISAFGDSGSGDIPDPYFDGSFDAVYQLLESVCADVLDTVRKDQPA